MLAQVAKMIINKALLNNSVTVQRLNQLRKCSSSDVLSGSLFDYCIAMSTPLHPSITALLKENRNHSQGKMAARPQVLQMNHLIIKIMRAKKVLDVGVFTGASSLTAALALPPDGSVTALDKSTKFTNKALEHWKDAAVAHKINLIVGPAKESLEGLIKEGGAGSYDFAFIDADKAQYLTYYSLSLELLRPGGVMVMDNTLWKGKVIDEECEDKITVSIRNVNQAVRNDEKVTATILPIGDGYTFITKK